MQWIERRITGALDRVGNSGDAGLRGAALSALLGAGCRAPDGLWVNPVSRGVDAAAISDSPDLIEVKRSGLHSKVRGPHVVTVERVMSLGPRDDPDALAWFAYLEKWLALLPRSLRTWHIESSRCYRAGDDESPCCGWPHLRRSDRLVHVAVPQVLPYLFCDYSHPGVTVNPDSKLVLFGGFAGPIWNFYDASPEEFGPNSSRFVVTTHAEFLNRLANALQTMSLRSKDREAVRDLATEIWCDMTWEEARQLNQAAHDLVALDKLDQWVCRCEPCHRRRGQSA